MDALREAGTQIDELCVIGGGSRSAHWGRILSSVLGVRLVYLHGGEVGPALGGARLAQMAVTGASAADVCIRPPVRAVIEPDLDLAARLAPKRAHFCAAYAALAPIKE
ncbi:MAG: hypothetical protein B7X78_03705 [Sphingomonadales bacterium 39-62-4]|nr:MAG: hypothetical protein B7X78_03705 [Sphingomonadales bacterium 39-62-4]